MSNFHVEKVQCALEITLVNDERLSATVFLDAVAKNHAGPQDPRELLNALEGFFPVIVGGQVIIVAKDLIKLVRFSATSGPLVPSQKTVAVKVMLADGSVVDGTVDIEMRTDAQRLLDHLNQFEGRFLPMVGSDRAHCLVNRRLIVGVQQR